MFQTKIRDKIKKLFAFNNFFPKTVPLMTMWKILYSRTGQRRQYGVCVLGAGLHKAINTHSGYVTFIAFHGNNGYTNVPECYVVRTLPVFWGGGGDATVQIWSAAPHC